MTTDDCDLHEFVEWTWGTPVWCSYCGGFLWGLSNQGLRCVGCGCPVHRKCVDAAVRETRCETPHRKKAPPAPVVLPDPEPMPPVVLQEPAMVQQIPPPPRYNAPMPPSGLTTSDGPAAREWTPRQLPMTRRSTAPNTHFEGMLHRRVLPPLPTQHHTEEELVTATGPPAAPTTPAPDPVAIAKAAQEENRRKAVKELVDTEVVYVEDLSTIVSVFLATIRLENLLPAADVARVFANIETILTLHHELLSGLLERDAQIGGCFLRLADYLKLYTAYCAAGDAQVAIVNEAVRSSPPFAKFVYDSSRRPECRQLDMLAFLIKPVQRLCKYPLLLREILRYSDPALPDTESLKRALAKISDVISRVNRGKRESDGKVRTVEIQNGLVDKDWTPLIVVAPHRRLLREGTLVEISASSGETLRCHYILFSDVLIRARQSWLSKLVLESSTALDLVEVTMPDGEANAAGVDTKHKWCFSLFLYGNSHTATLGLLVCCETARDREEWLLEIRNAKDALLPHDGLVMLDGLEAADFEIIPGSTTTESVESGPAPTPLSPQ